MAVEPTIPALYPDKLKGALNAAEIKLLGMPIVFTEGISGGLSDQGWAFVTLRCRFKLGSLRAPEIYRDFRQLRSNLHGFVESVEWHFKAGKVHVVVPNSVNDYRLRAVLDASSCYTRDPVSDRHALLLAVDCVKQFFIISEVELSGL